MSESSRSAPAGNDVTMTSNFLRGPKLRRQAFGGYSVEDTDALLQRAAATVDKLRKTVTALQQQPVAEPKPSVAHASGPAAEELPASKDAAAQAGEVIATAHEAVELLKEKAQRDADRIVEEAQGRAATVLAEAEKERTRLEQERVAAAGIVEDARAEAAQIVADAKRECDQIAVGRERLRSAADELRRSWIAQVSHVIDQLSDTPATPSGNGDAAKIPHELLSQLQDSQHAAAAEREGQAAPQS